MTGRETCTRTTEQVSTITPAAERRAFVWTAGDGSRAVLGIIDADATTLDPAAERHQFRVRLRSKRPGRWPRSVVMTAETPEAKWSFNVANGGKLRAIGVDATDIGMTVAAAGHRPANALLRKEGAGLEIVLTPLPVLTGIVIGARSQAPLSDVEIVTAKGVRLGATDGAGRFAVEVEDWPEHVTLDAHGNGTKFVLLPRVEADLDLGTLTVSRGGTLELTLDTAADSREELRLELARVVDDWTNKTVRQQTITATQATVTMENLEPGNYRVYLRGSSPLRIAGANVTIEERARVPLTIAITEAKVNGIVTRANEPVPSAEIAVLHRSSGWMAKITTDAAGKFSEPAWQFGDWTASVKAGNVVHVFDASLTGSEEVEWRIAVPARTIAGTVTSGGKTVADADVALQTVWNDEGMVLTTKTDRNGRYEFSSVSPGQQKLMVTAKGLPPAQPVQFSMAEAEQKRVVDVELTVPSPHQIAVTDHRGVAVAGALVTDGAGASATTDHDGMATLPLPPGQSRTVYVLPREGSFASAVVSGEQPGADAVTRISVPPGTASVRVRTIDRTGTPVADTAFVVRYNGRLLPMSFFALLQQTQGTSFRTGLDGSADWRHAPTGHYEIWPVWNNAEARSALTGAAVTPAVEIAALPGFNEAVLTLDAKKP